MNDYEEIVFYTDPACPYAWRTAHWIREVRSQRPIDIRWNVFSLEAINRATASERYAAMGKARKPALRTLVLAGREFGNEAFERLYFLLADGRHQDGADLGDAEFVDRSVVAAGLPADLRERALADESTEDYVEATFERLREQKAFGVPTIAVDGAKPFFGPVFEAVPRGEAAADIWDHVRALARHSEFFEIKRER